MREIALVVDALSTHGMDDQQIESVSRIRYLVHECLRDHAGSSIQSVATSKNDVGKMGRGKERTRRRGVSKRPRKGDPEEYYETSINTQHSSYYSDMDADQVLVYNVNNEVNSQHPEFLSSGDNREQEHHATADAVDDAILDVKLQSVETSEDLPHQNGISCLTEDNIFLINLH